MIKFTEEQQLMVESLRELVKKYPDSYFLKNDEERRYPSELAADLYENGFTLMGVPEEYGGTPADTKTLCLVAEELGRVAAPVSALVTSLTVQDILEFGTEEQKRKTMTALEETKGSIPFALAITEPQGGSDNDTMASTYKRGEDGKLHLNGHKCFITNADYCPYMFFLCKDATMLDQPPKKTITCFMVDRNTPGITIKTIDKIGQHSLNTCEVYYDDVIVEESDIVGQEHNGFMFLMKNFEAERMVMASALLGWAECAFEDAARYANQRVAFDNTIGSYQLIQKKITDMYVKIQNMKNLIYTTAEEMDEGTGEPRLSTALTKYYVGQTTMEVLDDAVQIFGAGATATPPPADPRNTAPIPGTLMSPSPSSRASTCSPPTRKPPSRRTISTPPGARRN